MKVSSDTPSRLIRGLVASLIIAPMLAPYAANAESAAAEAAQAVKANTECTRVSTFGQKALTAIQTRSAKLTADAAADAAKRQQQEAAFDTKVASDRAHWDQVRQDNFTKLTSDAKTSTQQAAVSTFESTVLADVSVRRAAVDQARTTYRSSVASDAASRLSALTSAITTFEGAVTAAVSNAEATCETGTAAGVSSTFVAAMKQARMNMTAAISDTPKLVPEVQALGTTRDSDVTQADSTFKTEVQQAATTLKTALGQS